MSNIINACSFSGHRDISIRDTDIACAVVDNIYNLYSHGCKDFYVGGALGFDMLAAMMLVSLKKKNLNLNIHFILPCADYNNKWCREDREKQNYLQTYAKEIVVLNESYHEGCMQERNRYLIDNTDCLIALLNRNTGGTYYTYKYALKNAKKIILI